MLVVPGTAAGSPGQLPAAAALAGQGCCHQHKSCLGRVRMGLPLALAPALRALALQAAGPAQGQARAAVQTLHAPCQAAMKG